MDRRNFLKSSMMMAAGSLILPSCNFGNTANIPPFLSGDKALYNKDPRHAALEWFRNARYGMFIHYGLYSLTGRGEWAQLSDKMHVADYAKLADKFTAEKFDADFITDLALEAGMKYINITTRHHDNFCLWDTKFNDFKSTNTPAKRDLVAELYEQCNKKGLGLYLYYSHGRDWQHPHAPNNDEWGGNARPKYEEKEPYYKYGKDNHIEEYTEYLYNQVDELLTMFPNVGAIWLDGIGVPKSGDYSVFKCQELYDMIHAKQPHMLVSYKQGLIGTEDFLAPERKFETNGRPEKPLEICDHLQRNKWGYAASQDGNHKTADEVVKMLKTADSYPANLLLNTGPLPSGEMHPEDVAVLREVGKRIRTQGWESLLA